MKKKLVRGLMVLAIGCISAGAGQARDLLQNVQLDVLGLAGYSTLFGAQEWLSAGNLYHSRFASGTKFAIGAEVPYGKLVSIQTGFTMGPNDLIVVNTEQDSRNNINYPTRFYSGNASLLLHAPSTKFHVRPYAELGLEYDRYSPTDSAVAYAYNYGFASVATAYINHNDKFGFNAGGGLDRRISKRLTFRIDLRDHVCGAPGFGLPHIPTKYNAAIYPVQGRIENIEYTAGFLIHVGKL